MEQNGMSGLHILDLSGRNRFQPQTWDQLQPVEQSKSGVVGYGLTQVC